jgi:peptidoglycan-N-acetylglucosamine deacetylase
VNGNKIRNGRFVCTTSWDDGHPLDLRIAELLSKYSLRGTFYVPLHNSLPTMSRAQIRELSVSFEIGCHTENHVRLTDLDDDRAKREIENSKKQMEDILGKACTVFCFPGGRYQRPHLKMLRDAGFFASRTVELLSLQRPRVVDGISLIPTTIQAYPHRIDAYLRNVVKRFSCAAIPNLLLARHARKWEEITSALLERAARNGGVFHLWGHSWEIEEKQQWRALDRTLAAMSQLGHCVSTVNNTELCNNDGTPSIASKPALLSR